MRKAYLKVWSGFFLISFAGGCTSEDFGEVEPLTPLIEYRYRVVGAAEALKSEFSVDDPEYIVGQLAYVEAASNVNAVIQQLILSLQSQTKIPSLSENSEVEDANSSIEDDISDALLSSAEFYNFVTRQVCDLSEAHANLCTDAGLLGVSGASLETTLLGLVPKIVDAIIAQSAAQREADEKRRKELVEQLESLLLEPFGHIDSAPPPES